MDALDNKRLRQDKKNLLRRQYRQEAREALFIKEYIQNKYPDAYEEAGAFYNYVNSIYPTKCDLRKTEEFKALRMGFTFIAKNKDKVLKKPLQVYQPITDLSQQNFTIHCYKMSETATETSQIPEEIQQPATETLQIPEEIQQPATETLQIPEEIQQPATETPQIPEEIQQPATETPQTVTQNKQTKKTMQLKIPLLPPTLITQPQKIVTQEIVEENILTVACNQSIPEDVQPIFNDEIPQETYETILRELRQDPDLAKIMDDIELDMMDVDLPLEDDRFEQELYNLW